MQFTNKLTKNSGTFIFVVFLLTACHSPANNETELQAGQVAETQHKHETTGELSLNNVVKWKADSSTNKNVTDLYNVVSDANPVATEDFHKTGKIIQANINKMISECHMQGAAHEALHQWLEPLMAMNKKLTDVASAEEGKELFGTVRKHIEKYSEFFE